MRLGFLVPLASILTFAFPCAKAEAQKLVFESAKTVSEHELPLQALDRSLPSDWSAYQYLVLEFRASSPQRFHLDINTGSGPSSGMLHPFAGAWVRAALPLKAFSTPPREGTDMASVYNKSHASYFLNLSGPYVPLNQVKGLTFRMRNPIGNPTLEIRSVRVTNESPGDAVLEKEPLVDEMGQWIRAEWPGKAKSVEELQKIWAAEEKTLLPGAFDYCSYGGYKQTKAKAAGFFRVEQIGGKWWFVDPDGHLFLSVGADVTEPWMNTRTENRAGVFAKLPPELPREVEVYYESGPRATFYTWNLFRRYGEDWHAKWIDMTSRRMDAWGMNTVGNWSDPKLWDSKRKPYTIPLHGWNTATSYMGLPDVYSDEFVTNCDQAAAKQCGPRKDDPWLLGYFIANEPPWPGRESLVVDLILAGPDTAIQRELKRELAGGDSPDRRKAFIYRAYEKYLEVVNQAVHKHDPNHLNLGTRFAGDAPEEMVKASRVFDVYSLNIYDYVPKRELLEKVHQLTGRPLLIGEFHFGTPGRGLSASLRQVRDYKERGVAYRYYVENAFSMPAMIGAHWFQWMDEPVTGRSDGENYNIGLVDVTDRPYADMVRAMQATHKHLSAVHGDKEAPFSQKALVQ